MKKVLLKILKSLAIASLLFFVNLANGATPVYATAITDSYADTTKINTGASSGYQVIGEQLKLGEPAKVGWWKLDEASGSAADSSGTGNTLTEGRDNPNQVID